MKKPISQATLARLVSNIRSSLKAFDEGDSRSVDYAEIVMGILTRLMKDGHVIDLSIWPQGGAAQIWDVCIDSIKLCIGGVLRDETAVPKLLKKGRSEHHEGAS